MKSCLAFYIAAALAWSGALAGCGQPGPLYLPKQPAKPAPAATAPSAPPSTVPASPQ